jgi:hypothetical protein
MHFAEADDFIEPGLRDEGGRAADPRQMTLGQLRRLGVPRLVYLRCGKIDGQMTFALHAADGTAIAVVEDIDLALEMVAANNMMFVSVH